jgi:pyruvate/2-oxoglutarate dehydrogenase complex dihydrolipoamide dehydrogenase (E3) component
MAAGGPLESHSPTEIFVQKERKMAQKFDAIVIGTGQSGPSLAARMACEGMQVAIAERKRFGGTCVNVGCTPTKIMVACARAAFIARRGAEYGVMIDGEISVDMKKVKARKDEYVRGSTQGIEGWLKGMENMTVFEGHARFEGPRAIRVGDDAIEAEKVFINVGARASAPPIPGLDGVGYLSSSDMMEIDYVPEPLLILGGSYIGLEFGQMFRRFGSEVTIIERGPRIISREDEDISEAIREFLEGEGVTVLTGAGNMEVEKRGDRIAFKLECGGEACEAVGSHLLVAAGRAPNTDNLGLDKAGIQVDARGYIEVDDELKTSAEGVWAMGDCNGRGAFTHTSWNDFEIVSANLFDGDPRRVSDRIVTYGLFVDPPLGRVGMTEAQARASGRKVLMGKKLMKYIGRAREKGETHGFMKFLVDADSKEFLGAAVLGVGGDELIHAVTDIIYAKAPYTVIQRAVHIHPTVSELVPTTLGEFQPLE